jgi:hypothetical protein
MRSMGHCALTLLLGVLLAGAPSGCLSPRFGGDWGPGASFEGFDPLTLNRGGPADFGILIDLSEIFYDRITARRFNSKATYDDPALREFFRNEAAFADFYASLAEALDTAHFESQRPTAVRLESMRRTTPNTVVVTVRLKGENGLPLRWWSTFVTREDSWQFADGRWWIVPGKV